MDFIPSITFLFSVYLFTYVTGYNLESRLVDVIEDPEYNPVQNNTGYDSYFGYTVAFSIQSIQDTNTTWLLIGAPRQSVAAMTSVKERNPGKVYKCVQHATNSSSWNCKPLHTLPKVMTGDKRHNVVLTDSWLGSTIVAENKPNGAVVICAAREKVESNSKTWISPGKCYGWENLNISDEGTPNYTDVLFKNIKDDPHNTKYGLALIGMSAHFVRNTDPLQLLLGGPGLFVNTGGVGLSEEMKLMDLHVYKLAEQNNDDKYLGYSVTSARFHKNGEITYISGAPRDTVDRKSGEYFTGTVYTGSICNKKWKLVDKLKGKQLGEYFGACLGVLDLNRDGIDDILLVGAPYYSKRNSEKETSRDQGQVYLFFSNEEGKLEEMKERLVGSEKVGALFGSTIAVVGDLDKDGFNDVAIGAPYEDDGKGAVYIYRGRLNSLETSHCQKLSANEMHSGLRGFGISIASGVDLDDNSFDDLAIGSYVSFNTVIIKSYPVVDIHASLKTEPSKLTVMDSSFNISACLHFEARGQPDKLPSIWAEIAISVDPLYRRTILQGSDTNFRTLKVILTHNTTNCTSVTARIMKKDEVKKNEVIQPIRLELEYKITKNPLVNRDIQFCKSCPMIDPHKPNKILSEVPITNGCKNLTCQVKLELLVESSYNQTNPLIMGWHNSMSLSVSISNTGEPAYSVRMGLVMPNGVKLIKVPSTSTCDTEDSDKNNHEKGTIVITCKLLNPIMTNQTSNSSLDLDFTSIPLNTKLISIMLKTWVDGDEKNHSGVNFEVIVPVKRVSQLYISGNTLQKSIPVELSSENETSYIIVSHKYEVVNKGPSPVSTIDAQFFVPFALERTPSSLHFLRVHYAKVTVGSYTTTCVVDYKGWEKNAYFHLEDHTIPSDSGTLETNSLNNLDGTNLQRRKRREIVETNTSETGPINSQVTRRLSLDYSKKDVIYAEVICMATFFKSLISEQRAEIDLLLQLDRIVLDNMLRNVDEVAYATVGIVKSDSSEKLFPQDIKNKSNNTARVETLFLGNVKTQTAPWIIPLSVVLGLLAMIILVKLLRKIGFFRRLDKEKLKLEKEKAAEEEFETEILDMSQ